jgi:hypothetical protein
MKYAVKKGASAIICIPNFIKIGSDIARDSQRHKNGDHSDYIN